MTSPDEDADNSYSFLVNVALAPYNKIGAKPHENAVYNSSVRFQVVVTKDVFGSVAKAARRLVEDAPSNIFLAPIISRELEDATVASAAVEFVYGDGYRTFVVRKDGPDPKSCRQVGVLLSIGDDDVEDPSTLPILMPDDDFWQHVMNTYDPYSGKGIPTVFIRTSELLFLYPANTVNQSSIALMVPTKRGFWTGLSFDGVRGKYPKELPKGATRKRKQIDESSDAAKEGGNEKKKVKIDVKKTVEEDSDDEEEPEEKPKKKKTPTKKKTPKKVEKEEVDDDDDDDDSDSEEEEKPPKKTPVKKKVQKKVKEVEDSEREEMEGKKKAKRKSTGKSKGSKETK